MSSSNRNQPWRGLSIDLSSSSIVRDCNTKYQQISQDCRINKFGDRDDPCLRLKNKDRKFKTVTHKIQINEKIHHIKLNKAAISFINAYNCYPNNINDPNPNNPIYCISHLCGNKKCIQASHMIIESQPDNGKRWKCHNYINLFINKYQVGYKPYIHNGSSCKLSVNYVRSFYNQYDLDDTPAIHNCSCGIGNNYKCFISFRQL